MYNRSVVSILFILSSIFYFLGCSIKAEISIPNKEDLWGNKVEFEQEKLTLVEPISPANCGYCLFDGEFNKVNYFENNIKHNGDNFLQCLFNPQLDIYTYQKHYRSNTPVLTFPLELHNYHRNGFPFIYSLKNGKVFKSGHLSPYEKTFNDIKDTFWPNKNVRISLTSPLHMATRFTGENSDNATTYIISDNDSILFKRVKKNTQKYKNGVAIYEKDLTDEDLRRNVSYSGRFSNFIFNLLKDKEKPFKLDEKNFYIGNYVFSQDSIAVSISFPNPYNKEKYLVLRLNGDLTMGKNIMQNWVDFTISKINPDNKLVVVMNGLFGKNEDRWFYADSLTFINPEYKLKCTNGICKSPKKKVFENHKIEFEKIETKQTNFGRITTFGKENCRFPEITTDKNNVVWCCWEENGDILLSSRNKSFAVENNQSDSFNPVITNDGSNIWIFYLNNQTGFYRIYAKYFDGNRVSDEMLISNNIINDAINLGVVSDQKGKIVIGWSEWQANYKRPKYRIIENRIMKEIKDIAVKKSEIEYTNAWSPSFTFSQNGEIWGSWNQHYPATLGVCSGNLLSEAKSVTQLKPKKENGGYPDCLNDANGKKWVFWESFGWDVLSENSQQIKGSFYDENSETWSLPYTISNDIETAFNQTPSASLDVNGNINVVWSHRDLNSEFWTIYLSTFKNNKWSEPIKISEPNRNSRAPQIISNTKGKLFITWHSGIGKEMRIKLLEYNGSL